MCLLSNLRGVLGGIQLVRTQEEGGRGSRKFVLMRTGGVGGVWPLSTSARPPEVRNFFMKNCIIFLDFCQEIHIMMPFTISLSGII